MELTFIDELLAEAEVAEAERKIELDKLRADQLLQTIGVIENKMEEVNHLATEEIKIIEFFRASELGKLERQRSWLAWNLEQYIRSTNEKTIRLPHGAIKVRQAREKTVVSNMENFLLVAGKNGLLRHIPESYEPDLQAIQQHIKRTGNIPLGVSVITGESKFSYDVMKGGETIGNGEN